MTEALRVSKTTDAMIRCPNCACMLVMKMTQTTCYGGSGGSGTPSHDSGSAATLPPTTHREVRHSGNFGSTRHRLIDGVWYKTSDEGRTWTLDPTPRDEWGRIRVGSDHG